MCLVDRTIKFIEERKRRLDCGKINCIPSPLKKFKYDFPGTEQATYYLISGGAKASKSKFTNFIFLFNTILFIYDNPDLIRLKVFYALLEETKMNIMMKFMCYVLYVKYKIRIDIKELKSIEKGRSVEPEIIDTIKSVEMQSILRFFEEHIEWIPDRNPTGIFNTLEKYAESHGIIHKKWNEHLQKEKFDWYEPNDPDEYVLCIIDHIGLISTERGFDLRESIKKLSEYLKILRNKYGYSPVVVQQQNSETLSLDAFKQNKVYPTQKGLLDCQDTARDCDIFLGIVNPYSFEFKTFGENGGYDITRLRSYGRWLKVVQGRDGESDATLGMYFDGATGWYAALPHYTDTAKLNRVYQLVQENRSIQS
jgi:hypothetical protein